MAHSVYIRPSRQTAPFRMTNGLVFTRNEFSRRLIIPAWYLQILRCHCLILLCPRLLLSGPANPLQSSRESRPDSPAPSPTPSTPDGICTRATGRSSPHTWQLRQMEQTRGRPLLIVRSDKY